MGQSVFPRTYEISPGKMNTIPGISLRQLYAGLAMHAIISASGNAIGEIEFHDETVAESAFNMADALLAEEANR